MFWLCSRQVLKIKSMWLVLEWKWLHSDWKRNVRIMGRDGQERHEENEMEINWLWFRQKIADSGKIAGGLGEFILLQIFIFLLAMQKPQRYNPTQSIWKRGKTNGIEYFYRRQKREHYKNIVAVKAGESRTYRLQYLCLQIIWFWWYAWTECCNSCVGFCNGIKYVVYTQQDVKVQTWEKIFCKCTSKK